MKNKSIPYLIAGVVLVAVFVGATVMYRKSQEQNIHFLATEQAEVFVREYSPKQGNEDAKVVLTEFLDPECESCRVFYPLIKSILSENEGKLQLVVRYAAFHGNSKTAIKALEAARFQNKYWEALEKLFYHQPEWGDHHHPKPELIFDYLAELGLDIEKLKTDMEAPKIMAMIDQDEKDLRTLNVRGTPTFFVNGKPLTEFSENGLRTLISSEIEKAYSN